MPRNLAQEERDLLIEIKVQVQNLTQEFKALKDDTVKKIAELETGKVSYQAFREFKDEVNKEKAEYLAQAKAVHEDHEKRLHNLETYYIKVGAVIATVLFLMEMYFRFFK